MATSARSAAALRSALIRNNATLAAAAPLRIVLMGAPGAGKGTQAARIEKEFGLLPLSTGNMLRSEIEQGSAVGKTASEAISQGKLVSDGMIMDLVSNVLSRLPTQSWQLDGFPRTLKQAELFEDLLLRLKSPLHAVVNLDVPEEVIISRISDRWVHVASGRVYNLHYNPPKIAGIDDITGEPLTKRDDDNAEVVKQRLKTYKESTLPLLDFYAKHDLLLNFKGATSDIIYPQIQKALHSLQWLGVGDENCSTGVLYD